MALSGFIKQLLETDSVFGSEAKKFTGINDSSNTFIQLSRDSYKPAAEGVEIRFDVARPLPQFGRPHVIVMQLPQFGPDGETLFPVPDFFSPGNFIKLNITNFSRAANRERPASYPFPPEHYRETARLISGVVLQIQSISTFISRTPNPNIVITFNNSAGDAPALINIANDRYPRSDSELLELFGPIDLEIDGRIGSIINNSNIAEISGTGATRFNLDNVSPGPNLDRGSGIASKYASHYHGDKAINLVTNFRDDAGNPLYGVELNETELQEGSILFSYDPTEAFNYVESRNIGTTDQIRINYKRRGVETAVATYGYIGTRGFGEIRLSGLPTVRTDAFDHGTRVSLASTTFEYGLPLAQETANLKRWAPPAIAPPDVTLFENLRTLRDAMRLHIDLSRWFFDITSVETASLQVMRVTGGKNEANNLNIPFAEAPLAMFPVVSTTAVSGCSSQRPISGNEFITFEDLFSVLSVEPSYDIDVVKTVQPNSLELSTTLPPTKQVTFISPSTDDIIFVDQNGLPIFTGAIGGQALNQVIRPADLVFDLSGNVVFSSDALNN